MHIWNTHALARDIRSHRVGRIEKFVHGSLMLFVVLLCWLGVEDDRLDPLVNASWIAAAQAGAIYICYCANTQGDGSDFWMRLCLMGVPVALRSLCVLMFVVVFASLPFEVLRPAVGNVAEAMRWLSGLPPVEVLAGGIALWGWRVSVHLERIARSSERQAGGDAQSGIAEDAMLSTSTASSR